MFDWYAPTDYLDLFEAMAGDFGRVNVQTYNFGGYVAPIFNKKEYFSANMDFLPTPRAGRASTETRCPDPWQNANNEAIHAAAEGHDNVGVIDWFAESTGHDEWFWNDGEHVRPEGAQAYVMMLRKAITGR